MMEEWHHNNHGTCETESEYIIPRYLLPPYNSCGEFPTLEAGMCLKGQTFAIQCLFITCPLRPRDFNLPRLSA